jgi:hypothetical protein
MLIIPMFNPGIMYSTPLSHKKLSQRYRQDFLEKNSWFEIAPLGGENVAGRRGGGRGRGEGRG